jgi:hypothetical protein
MASLRSIATIPTKKIISSKKELTYTLVPGETKKNYCKIMINIRSFTGNNPFTISYAKEMIQRYAKKRREHQFKSGHIRTERIEVLEEEANSLIRELSQQGYLKYVLTRKRDKLHPNIPEDGIKYYAFDKFKVIECEESKYFQQKLQRKTEEFETKGKLSDKRCRALRQIYAQFGDKSAFTYEMVMNIPKFYKKMADTKDEEMKPETRVFYLQAAQHSESRNEDFKDTWNSLIRNNYLIPYKVRAKDGTIKTVFGAYKVNMLFVKDCLSGVNL